MSHVFISYASEDWDFANKLHDRLEESGIDAWIDKYDIKQSKWDTALEDAIQTSQALVFLASPHSIDKNSWAREELCIARDNNVEIIPVFYRIKKLPITAIRCQAVDYLGMIAALAPNSSTHLAFDELVAALIHTIASVLPQHEPSYENPASTARRLALAAEEKVRSGNMLNALNRVTLAERICPIDRQELLGDILFLKEEINRNLAQKRCQEAEEARDRNEYLEADEITRWSRASDPGANSFYVNVRFALALEKRGTGADHQHAIGFLRKAFKLEPRVLDQKWMKKHYEWDDELQALIERLLPDFLRSP